MVRIPTHRPPTHPGEILLEEVPLNQVNEIVKAKRGVTPDTALRLERLLGASAQSWLNAQLAWDLYHALHSPAAGDIP